MTTQHSFSVYNASAGSGKTYTLVKEYLKIILASPQDDAYRNILAITFTNKAVHEMKSRVLQTLSEFSKETPSDKAMGMLKDISESIGKSQHEITQKSQRIVRHLIHNYAAFDISTIDKFTHRVIRTFAHDLDLPAIFEVSLDTDDLLTEAVDALIAKAGEDPALTKLLVDFTMEKADDDKSWDVSREIFDTGRLILNENNRHEVENFRDKTIGDFTEVKQKLREECRKMELRSVELANKALHLIETRGIESKSFYRESIPKHFKKLSAGELIKNISHYQYLEEIHCKRCPAKTSAAQKALVDAVADELMGMLREINEIAEKYMFYSAFLSNITPLSLLNSVSKELKQIQQEQQVLSIAEFNKIIYEQISNQPAPFIYERMGERYRHFFIDEFQDTSEMQWQNLIPLINDATSSENLQGEKGTLMIVGDPKQSIYRWRGGKAEQFIQLAKCHNPFNNKSKQSITLERNFRSYSEVIGFNNSFFKMLSEEFSNEDYADLYLNYSHQQINDKLGGYVELSFIKDDGTAEESPCKNDLYLRSILKTIQNSVADGFSPGDIVVLTRKREQGVLAATYLTENGVRIVSSETLLIKQADDVRLIIAVLRYLHNRADSQSKAAILYHASKAVNTNMQLHDFIAEGLSVREEERFSSWLNLKGISFNFSDARRKSLYQVVEMIIGSFLRHKIGSAYIQFLLDIVLEREVKAQAGVSEFLEFWDKNCDKISIPSPESNEAVRIMTIHKAKGLEFPVVIFPFADENFSRKPKEKIWLDADEEVFGIPKVLVDNSSMVEEFGESAAAVYNEKKEENLLDNINVLYVAFTRAEKRLHVISSMNLLKDDELPKNCVSSLLIKFLQRQGVFHKERFEYFFGKPDMEIKEQQNGESPTTIKPVSNPINHSAIQISKREAMLWTTERSEAIAYGNLLHELMSKVIYLPDVDVAIEEAIAEGLIPAAESDKVLEAMLSIVTHPDLGPFFNSENLILNEQAIIRKQGPVVKPDRLVITAGNEAYLLDYKTGVHDQKYVQQLQTYEDAVSELGYSVSKKVLVYVGMPVNVVNLML